MQTFSSRTAVVRRTVFTLALGVALTGAASLTAWSQPHPHDGPMGGPDFLLGGPPEHMGRGIDRMLDSVNASDAQRTQIKQIAQTAAAEMKTQHEAGKSLRMQQMKLFAQPTVDANAVETVRQQMLAQHDQTSRRITQAMLDISRVLTPAQRSQLAQQMQARADLMQRQHAEWQQLDKQ